MIKAMYTAATGMTAQQTHVDVIANNLANVNTAGFRRSSTHFQDMLYVNMVSPGAQDANGASLAGIQVGSGARLLSTTKSFQPGTLVQTGAPLDMAIAGEGFFELQGANGEQLYTRDAHFLRDAAGNLVNSAGFLLQPGVNIPQDAVDITINRDGQMSWKQAGAFVQGPQIQLSRFPNPTGLESVGENLYAPTDNSGAAVIGTPGQDGFGTIQQYFEERSNVDVATELINMIVAQRAFEMNSRAIRTADDMLSTTNNITQ